ncbi:NAD(P)H-dependent oxidoreductase [Campylobacter sputorum]|uniref:NAD(P)H-dependent oxidoreductase n=1 Tax=Campylobacter sputorum TaxID=206 RepID=UPI001E2D86E1|nr:NAD(P)H-dependent oxidoreductase [Campylobacter sputorum]
MENIFLINGGKKFGNSDGRLNKTLHDVAKQTLIEMKKNVSETVIDNDYNTLDEVQKYLNADVVIYQMPAWWMGEPWIVKKYIDEVFSSSDGKFFKNDGRSSVNPTKNYGKGGLLKNKKYMFSLTWNAPIEAFNDKDGFFCGVGVDVVYMHLHKAHEFIGMSALPTFICNDVVKNPLVNEYIQNYKNHLRKVLS